MTYVSGVLVSQVGFQILQITSRRSQLLFFPSCVLSFLTCLFHSRLGAVGRFGQHSISRLAGSCDMGSDSQSLTTHVISSEVTPWTDKGVLSQGPDLFLYMCSFMFRLICIWFCYESWLICSWQCTHWPVGYRMVLLYFSPVFETIMHCLAFSRSCSS